MKTVRLTMAQALVRFLDRQYVERDGRRRKFVRGIFGIFGHGNVTGIGEALEYSRHRLMFIRGGNEQGMVHAAIGYAKQLNRLGIFAVTSSIGPGATNMVTGAATATINRVPVLLLPGDVFACRQPDPVLQQLEAPHDCSLTVNDCFKPVSRYWDRITRPEQLMTALLNAFRVLTDPEETGAVTLALPQDVQAEAYDYPESFFAERVHHLDRRAPSPRALAAAAATIARARRPLVIAGGGALYSEAAPALRALASRFGLPVAETQAGKSAIDWESPQSLGGIGVTGTQAANRLARDADVILAVGSRLSDFTTCSKTLFHPRAKLVALNLSAFDGEKMDGLLLQADARLGLLALDRALRRRRFSAPLAWRRRTARCLADWRREVDRLHALKRRQGLAQTAVLGVLNRHLRDEDVVVGAAGSLPGDLHRLWRSRRPKSYHLEYGYSCMGYEVAAGLGVKLAEPEAEVYVAVGDGSYLMLHSELLTSLQEGRKINVVLFDNGGFQCIHNLQRSQGSRGYGVELRCRDPRTGRLEGALAPVDFAQYAAALGAKTFRAATLAEFAAALAAARREKISTLIEVKVEPGTMTRGYDSFWRVGVAEVSASARVRRAGKAMARQVARGRKY